MMIFNLIILAILLLAGYLDIRYKKIPSVLLTSSLFVALIIYPQGLLFGVIAFIFAYLLGELQNEGEWGVADIKIITLIGIMIPTRLWFFAFIIMFLIFQFAYVITWRKILNKKDVMPFVPCIVAVYITLLLLGGLA